MSLRWRLALALALLAGLATITTASFAYVSTRDRLYAENDRFLTDRSASYRNGPGMEGPPPLVDTGPLGERVPAPLGETPEVEAPAPGALGEALEVEAPSTLVRFGPPTPRSVGAGIGSPRGPVFTSGGGPSVPGPLR